MVEARRATAKRILLEELRYGMFLRNGNASYFLSSLGDKISRVRVVGTVVDKYVGEEMESLRIDDGTSQLRCKSFGQEAKLEVELGDLVEVIGKVREYGGEIYISVELVKRVSFESFLLHRLEALRRIADLRLVKQVLQEYKPKCADAEELKHALKKELGLDEEAAEAVLAADELFAQRVTNGASLREKVLALIRELDKGEGCEYSELLKRSSLAPEVLERVVTELLDRGLCFEPKPGVIKPL